jgi:flavodoxin
MKQAVVIYHSRTGTTKKYADEIGKYLELKSVRVNILSTAEFQPEMTENMDYVLLGCWTNGLFFILQHPDKAWKNFAKKLRANPDAKLALFTTYKFVTGSMFTKMYVHLEGKFSSPVFNLQSRDGTLSDSDRLNLDSLLKREHS